jgi:branched-chain amino acid transport system permease protein
VRTAGVSFIMITLAMAQLVYSVALNAPWAGSTDGMLLARRPLAGIPGIDLERPAQFYGYCLLLAAAGYALMRRLVDSPFGRALQGIRVNPERMEAMGYRTAAYKLAAFTQAGVFAGVAGHCFAAAQFFIDPTSLHWTASGQVLMMVVLGGEGTLIGPALGALVFHGLEQWISSYTKHWMLPMGVILVLLVLAGRGGLVRIALRSIAGLRARLAPREARGAPPHG